MVEESSIVIVKIQVNATKPLKFNGWLSMLLSRLKKYLTMNVGMIVLLEILIEKI